MSSPSKSAKATPNAAQASSEKEADQVPPVDAEEEMDIAPLPLTSSTLVTARPSESDPLPMPPPAPLYDPEALTNICAFCLKKDTNLVTCSNCKSSGHIKCLQFKGDLAKNVRTNPNWLCMDCKRCTMCKKKENDSDLLFCDNCDDAVHMYCTKPRLNHVPRGQFFCHKCLAKGLIPQKKQNKKRKSSSTSSTTGTPAKKSSATKAGKTVSSSKGSTGKRKVGRPPKSGTASANPTPMRRTARLPKPRKRVLKCPFEGLGIAQGEIDRYNSASQTAIKALHKAPTASAALQRMHIEIGKHRIKTWYSAAYPHEYSMLPTLYICEFCLRYFAASGALQRHMAKCECEGHPPGDEIYRGPECKDEATGKVTQLQLWEVDGEKAKLYCQNVCLLARLFLDHKTLYYDVEPFLFYVLTARDDDGAHFIGYFSKEKYCLKKYNVSCILTLPSEMKKGYGKYLIKMSYLITRREGMLGSPEKPLSHLGALSYKSYWKQEIHKALAQLGTSISIGDIAKLTGMTHQDIADTLVDLGYLKEVDGSLKLVIDRAKVLDKVASLRKPKHEIDESRLLWIPFNERPGWR
eukprot:TRINITY_DN6100_c0_g1_i1.p1 TRINITY_DN6100_c0_g1~~TRINITY_DN6100_c0_g1_i1.p1  ORF type:complete len:578 (+),score=137.04 TRINITY_DN6100_c0_g1_i1:120-1853(+)